MNITNLYNSNERIIAGSIIISVSAIGLITHSISLIYLAKTSTFYNAFGFLCISNAIASILSEIEMIFYCGPVTIMSHDPVPLRYIYILGHISDGLTYVTFYSHIFKSINRHYAICHPFLYNKKATKQRIYTAIIVVWLISFIQASPFFLDDCSYYYSSDIMTWMYTPNLCGKIMGFYIDFILSSIQLTLVLFLDTWTLIYFKFWLQKNYLHKNTYNVKQKSRREFAFFIQNYILSILYILQNIAFFIVDPLVPFKWGNFFATTIALQALIMVDGIIMAVFTRMICAKKIYQNENALQVQPLQHENQFIKTISSGLPS